MILVLLLNTWFLIYEPVSSTTEAVIDIKGNCSGTFDANAHHIHSPNYPNSYQGNDDCSWIIIAPRRHSVELSFHQFSLEDSDNCENDWLAIYDYYGAENTSLIDTFCSYRKPRHVISITNILKLRFKTS